MSGNSIINLGELSKPATVLIEKVSDLVGGAFRPSQIVRVAKAEAKAALITAESQVEITDLQRRALQRFLLEEGKKQQNMEDITQLALPELKDDSKPEEMDDDWVTNFFDKCRLVADEEMQGLWSRILAGEANSPGTYSKRTVNLLSSLDKGDAELFTRLCGFGWLILDLVPLILDERHNIYNQQGINFDALIHLESIGLIQFGYGTGFAQEDLPPSFEVFYYETSVHLEMPVPSDNTMRIGKVLLTKAGHELALICGSRPVVGFLEYMTDEWKKSNYIMEVTTGHSGGLDADSPVPPPE
jgi:hypothetical protein